MLVEGKQQVLKDLSTCATDEKYFWLPLDLSLSWKNQAVVYPREMRYYLIWPLKESLLALLGSILELERCDQQCVESSCFDKYFLKYVCMLETRAPSSLLLNIIVYLVSPNFTIILEPFLYDNNFEHIRGDFSSLFFPESWYKCDSAEHATSYVNELNQTSTSWLSHVTCSCLPLFNFFLEGDQKYREDGEYQMLQLDSYWSLDIWVDCS